MLARWYALVVKSQHEKAVGHHLEAAGVQSFVPLYRSRRQWSDRVKELDLPLFSNYVFGRFSWQSRAQVLAIPGVRRAVGTADVPAPIPDAEIEALQRTIATGLPARPWPFLKSGQRVRITRGPLQGVEGILVLDRKNCELVLSVELLQRAVAVRIGEECVESIAGAGVTDGARAV